jgi:hypothetical protein
LSQLKPIQAEAQVAVVQVVKVPTQAR